MVVRALFATFALVVSMGCGGGAVEERAPSETAPKTKIPSSPGAELSGVVVFTGDVPAASVIQMGADPNCARLHPGAVSTDRVVVGDDGGLKNVFVYIKEGLEGHRFDIPEEAVLLDQQGCVYAPHVLGVRAGQTLTIMNSDDTLHNVHAFPELNDEFNIGQPVKGMKTNKTLPIPEIMIPFRCDVHKWMASYVGVVDHPFFATTDIDGAFTIPGLPSGDYVVEAWHEKYGTQQMSVSVATDSADVTFEYEE